MNRERELDHSADASKMVEKLSDREELARLIAKALGMIGGSEPDPHGPTWQDEHVICALGKADWLRAADALLSSGFGHRKGGLQDCMAYILTRRLERGETVDAEAIERARVLCGPRPEPTNADRDWAAAAALKYRIASPFATADGGDEP